MATWIEVPAHRVLELTINEADEGFDVVTEEGERKSFKEARTAETVMPFPIIVRNADGKRFRCPRYVVALLDFGRLIRFEEV